MRKEGSFFSLYPSINYGYDELDVFPVAEPDILIGVEVEERAGPVESWYGLAKVTLAPPRHLHIPVIGETINNKYQFHLCSKCVRESRQDFCNHTNEERWITTTIFTGELQLALKKNYTLIKCWELWNWPEERRSRTLFRGLMREQYCQKLTSSSIPTDPEEFLAHIRQNNKALGLSLSAGDFSPNSVVKAFAKLCINAFWGYFATHCEKNTTSLVTCLSEYLGIENDPNLEITNVSISADESCLLVSYTKTVESPGKKQVHSGYFLHSPQAWS